MPHAPHIRIVGGGVAGLILATRLGDRLGRGGRAQISLIDDSGTHVWKPMLHTFAAGTWSSYQEQVAYWAHACRHHFRYIPGKLSGLDRERHRLHLAPLDIDGERIADARELDYDVLILAVGSRADDFGTDGVEEHCHFIDTQAQAEAFNARLRAHIARSVIQQEPLHVAIVGGGATGVELAAELSRVMELAASYGDPELPERLQLTLLEAAPRILGAFPEKVATLATGQLKALGVEVRCGIEVAGADEEGFRLADGSCVPARLKVWAAGIKAANAYGDGDGLELTESGQIRIGPSLQVVGDTRIFAVGDCSSLTPAGQARPLPATAQVAHQQANHLIRHLPDWLETQHPIPAFRMRDFGSLVSLGDYNAFGTLGRFGFFKGGFIRGRFAQFSHAMLYRRHQLALHGPFRTALLWLAEQFNSLVKARIRSN